MNGYFGKIEELTLNNNNFRQVLYTATGQQLVLMSLLPKEDIGEEVHNNVDQFFRFEKGQGKVIIDGEEILVGDGDAVVVPRGARHNVINISETESLKLYTIYSPPEHPEGTTHQTKAEAMAVEEHHH